MRTLCTLWLFVALGCATAGPEPDPPTTVAEYASLQVGATRTYNVRFPGQEGRLTVRTVKEEGGWYIDDRSGRMRLDGQGLRDPQRYLIRGPLVEGTEWRAVLSASAVERYRIASVGAPCSVAAGRFDDCLVVESSIRRDADMSLEARWTWIKGVGLAQITTTAVLPAGRTPQTKQDLVHFDL